RIAASSFVLSLMLASRFTGRAAHERHAPLFEVSYLIRLHHGELLTHHHMEAQRGWGKASCHGLIFPPRQSHFRCVLQRVDLETNRPSISRSASTEMRKLESRRVAQGTGK